MFAPLCAIAFALSNQALEVRPPDSDIPLEPANSQVVISAKIAGKSAKFSIDTGSFEVRIQPESAKQLNLFGDSVNAQVLGNVRIQAPFDLTIGNTVFSKVPVDTLHIYNDTDQNPVKNDPFDGIIGLNFLEDKAIGIDIQNGRFAIWKKGKLSPRDAKAWLGEDGIATPLTRTKMGRWRIPGSWQGKKGTFVFDTGSGMVLQTDAQAKPLGIGPGLTGPLQFLEGTWTANVSVAPPLTVPWRTLSAPWAVVLDAAGSSAAKTTFSDSGALGVVGLETINYGKAIFDFPGKKLYVVAHDPRIAWADYLGSFGFRIFSWQGKAAVVVRPGGPAAKAGLANFDLLDSLGGVPANDQTETNPIAALLGKDELDVVVHRDQKTLHFTLKR